MKLLPTNSNWRVQSLGRRNIDDPMREANAMARASKAWGDVGVNAAKRASDVLMDIYEESSAAEAQGLYVKAIEDLNELENTMYTTQQFGMESPEMLEVTYDDSYTETVDGKQVQSNYGYAPKHVVGAQVWSTRSNSIVADLAGSASSDKVRKMMLSKLQPSMTAKNQSVGRHVLDAAVADRKTSLKFGIDESLRIGDLPGALMLSEEGYRRGIISQKEANDYDAKSYNQNDVRILRQEISKTETEASLAKISETAIFGNSYLTPAQRGQLSSEALSKSRLIHQRMKEQLALTQDENEIDGMIEFHRDETNVSTLLDERFKYNRAGFTRLYKFMTSQNPKFTDSFTGKLFQERIMNVQFYSSESKPVATTQVNIMEDMQQAVLQGTLTYDDFIKNAEQLDKNAKAPFKRQPYEQTKVSIITSIFDNIDADTLAELTGSMDIDTILMNKMGTKPAVAALGVRAINDLNAYMRNYGYQADPIKWWNTNKDNYKAKNRVEKYATEFAAQYPQDTVLLSNGEVDVQGTQDNVIRNYRNGLYGPQGETESLKILDRRSRLLRGEPSGAENEQY